MANIFLSVPIMNRPELKMIYSMYKAILSCSKHKVTLYFNENDSLISRVRNVHASVFLNEHPDCDYFMSFDSDIEIVNTFPNNNVFDKLIGHDKDFVGGLYAIKRLTNPLKCSSIPYDMSDPLTFNSGLVRMNWLASGSWCLKRSVLEKMANAYPDLLYDGDDNAAGKKIYGFYMPFICDVDTGTVKIKKYLSEDWAFSERWKRIGGEIYADTSIALKHVGKYSYDLYDVKVTTSQEPPKPKESSENLPEPGFDL